MKTKLFFFAMFVNVAASAQVTNVTPVSANYTDKTVSFRVWWNAGSRDETHLSKVWVWVDYITVNSNNTTAGNAWTRATVGTVSGGATSYDGSYRNGFWLEGNASTNYSATLTVQLTNTPAKFNWCAYVSDYPPNVTAANGTYTFRGTPPFTLTASNGSTQTVTETTLTASALTITPTTIRDKTDCPGVFCIYSGSDLYVDATHLCQQRTSGAQNWEAWIKDTRDDKLYRIVQMPDNNWWLAQPLAREAGIYSTNSNTGVLYYADTTAGCPSKWAFPSVANWKDMVTAYGGSSYTNIKTTTGWAGASYYAGAGTDYYSISIAPTGVYVVGGTAWKIGWYNTTLTFQMGPAPLYRTDSRNTHRGMGWGFGCSRDYGQANEHCDTSLTSYTNYDGSWQDLDLNWGANKDSDSRAPLRCFRRL